MAKDTLRREVGQGPLLLEGQALFALVDLAVSVGNLDPEIDAFAVGAGRLTLDAVKILGRDQEQQMSRPKVLLPVSYLVGMATAFQLGFP